MFERKEDARFVCDSVSEDFACLIVKEYETDKKPANNVYYFVVNERRYTMDNNCFVSKEDTLEYIKKMGLIDHFEIHGHKLNSIDSGKDSIDENGNIIKPNDEDLEYSFYNLVPLLKEKRIEFEYFEQDYMDEAKLQK